MGVNAVSSHNVLALAQHRNIQSTNAAPTPKRTRQKRQRVKEYLTACEVEQLMEATKDHRHSIRNRLLILLAWRHGLRCEELVSLKLNQVNISGRELYVMRVKGSVNNHHPLEEDEIRLLKRYLRERQANKGASSEQLFLTERGEGMQPHAFNHLLNVMAKRAGFTFKVYPHMLRHACGFHLANKGVNAFMIQSYLGHKQISNTMRYVHVSAAQFKDLKGIW
jgi:type 1 fimbriae regulatory protein FimB